MLSLQQNNAGKLCKTPFVWKIDFHSFLSVEAVSSFNLLTKIHCLYSKLSFVLRNLTYIHANKHSNKSNSLHNCSANRYVLNEKKTNKFSGSLFLAINQLINLGKIWQTLVLEKVHRSYAKKYLTKDINHQTKVINFILSIIRHDQ